MAVTMKQIADTVNKPESTIYRWKKDNLDLYTAAKEYAERKHKGELDKQGTPG